MTHTHRSILLHTSTENANKLQSENSVHDNNTEIIYAQEIDTEKEPPKWVEKHVLSNEDLVAFIFL